MRMLQIRGCLDLGEESFCADCNCELRFQYLDCDLAIVLEVFGEIDRRHATCAELPVNAVSVGKCSAKSLELVGQNGLRLVA